MFHESFIHKHTGEAQKTPDTQLRHVSIFLSLILYHVKKIINSSLSENTKAYAAGNRDTFTSPKQERDRE